MNPDIIDFKGLSTIYEGEGNPAIYDIDLKVSKGEWVCIIGPNGSGKTTLLETVNGYLPYSKGSGTVFGKEILSNLKHIRIKTGYVVQNFDIDPLMPFLCRDIVMTSRSAKIGAMRFTGKGDWDVVDRALETVGMTSFANRPVGKLSGGEYQKILLARAIAKEPELLLLDEPFSNMDIESRRTMQEALAKLQSDRDLTILMVSHGLDTIPEACNRLVVMCKGKVVMDGQKAEIMDSEELPKHFMNGRGPYHHTHDITGRSEHV